MMVDTSVMSAKNMAMANYSKQANDAKQETKVDYTKPEKARADMDKKIKDYYDNSAKELAIVLKCYMDAGFSRREAFEICKMLVDQGAK